MAKAAFFDLDDTLHSLRVYSLERLKAAAQRVSRDHSHIPYETFYHSLVRYYDEGFRTDLLNRALAEYFIFEERYLMELVNVYRSTCSTASLYDDSLPVLRLLSRKGVPLFLFTDGNLESQRCKVRALGLEKYFDRTVYTGEFEERLKKPCIKLFLDILDEYRIDPGRTLAVGDNPHRDFVHLKRQGILTLRIRRADGRFSNVTLDEAFEAHFNITSLREVFYFMEVLDAQ